jgi:hypothetical protein
LPYMIESAVASRQERSMVFDRLTVADVNLFLDKIAA